MRRWLVPLIGMLAVVGGVVLLRGQVPEMQPPPEPEPTVFGEPQPPFVISADIASDGTVYGVIIRCTDNPFDPCRYELAVSQQSGAWSRRQTPPVQFDEQNPVVREVLAFDGAVVLTEWSPLGASRAWVSRDGGWRWTAIDVGGRTIDRIPDGAVLRHECPTSAPPANRSCRSSRRTGSLRSPAGRR